MREWDTDLSALSEREWVGVIVQTTFIFGESLEYMVRVPTKTIHRV